MRATWGLLACLLVGGCQAPPKPSGRAEVAGCSGPLKRSPGKEIPSRDLSVLSDDQEAAAASWVGPTNVAALSADQVDRLGLPKGHWLLARIYSFSRHAPGTPSATSLAAEEDPDGKHLRVTTFSLGGKSPAPQLLAVRTTTAFTAVTSECAGAL
jgi:hypothetical protein